MVLQDARSEQREKLNLPLAIRDALKERRDDLDRVESLIVALELHGLEIVKKGERK